MRVDYETVLYGKTWYDWGHWFDALALRPVKPAGTLRFSHYDMAIEAAIAGGGVAIGKWPHLASHLREGTLRAPLGRDWIARLGGFHVVFARDAEKRDAVVAFVAWLKEESGVTASARPGRLASFRGRRREVYARSARVDAHAAATERRCPIRVPACADRAPPPRRCATFMRLDRSFLSAGSHGGEREHAEKRDAVPAFVAWLQAETRRDRERAPASLGLLPGTKAGGERAARAR